MATLHLMVGLPGAGKTTLAKQLERALPALRLTPDEWQIPLFGQDFLEDEAAHNQRHDLIESLLWNIAARALELGVNVILDYGFWAKVERDDFRARAAKLGAGFQIHFVDVDEAELLARVTRRNAENRADAYAIPAEKIKQWFAFFQRPTPEELGSV
ncbi:MAG TPA: AAA family ATPase [Thermoflexales bacterium]|nr:AAA family ATPase [Thermoflexales bacterium]